MWIVTQVAAVSNAGVAMSPGTHPELGAMELMLPPGWDHGVPVSCCHLLQVPVRCSCPASILPGGQRCCVWAGEPHVLPHPRAKRAQWVVSSGTSKNMGRGGMQSLPIPLESSQLRHLSGPCSQGCWGVYHLHQEYLCDVLSPSWKELSYLLRACLQLYKL